MQNPNYQELPFGFEVTIYKPLYGNPQTGWFIYIRDSILQKAVKQNMLIRVEIPGICTNVIKPSAWLKTGRIIYKEFKIPGSPMKLVGNYLKLPDGAAQSSTTSEQGRLPETDGPAAVGSGQSEE